MNLINLFLCVALFASVTNVLGLGQKLPFSWEDCGRADRRLVVNKVKVLPNPIVLYGKTVLNISADVKLVEELNDSTTVSIKIHRITKLFARTLKIPIPCLDGFLGSCTMSFCKYFNDPRAHQIFCSILKKLGRECTCPLAADRYVASNVGGTLALDALPVPAALLRLGTVSVLCNISIYTYTCTYALKFLFFSVSQGNYQLELNFLDSKKRPFGCFKMTTHIDFKM